MDNRFWIVFFGMLKFQYIIALFVSVQVQENVHLCFVCVHRRNIFILFKKQQFSLWFSEIILQVIFYIQVLSVIDWVLYGMWNRIQNKNIS
jgi:hypothetical protein